MAERVSKLDTMPHFEARTREEWRAWLEANHTTSTGVWLVTFKRGSGETVLAYEEFVEEALCFGWIDSKRTTLDERRTRIAMTPRKAKSIWSAVNKERIARLTAGGLMRPPGIAAVEVARANGSWDALNASDSLDVPEDLAIAMAAFPEATANWERFPPSARKMILYWISSAKRPETRAARVSETARLANENVRSR